MKEEMQRLWIVPGSGLEDKNLIDGQPIFLEGGIGNRDHKELLENFIKEHNVDCSFLNSHLDYGRYLSSLGIVVLFNGGRIDGKMAAGMFLPKQLTEKQIMFFESRKKLFKEKFHEDVSYFEARIYNDKQLPYRTTDGLRNLKIESIIEGRITNNGQELLFRELERQKQQVMGDKSL